MMLLKRIIKYFMILLLMIIIIPVTVFATDTKNLTIYNGKTPNAQTNNAEFKSFMNVKEQTSQILNHLDKMDKEKKVDDFTKRVNTTKTLLPILQDVINGNGFDYSQLNTALSSILSLFGPYGELAGSVVDFTDSLIKTLKGGEEPISQLTKIQNEIKLQFNDVKNQISDLEEDINDLSNEINNMTNVILNELHELSDDIYAKKTLSEFMLKSGIDDFGYNQYRNYIYGDIYNNTSANTAYYSLYKKAILDNKSQDDIKYYCDKLYTALMNDWNIFYEQVIGSNEFKSIGQCYYDVVSSNSNIFNKYNTTPEVEAIKFIADIYQTEIIVSKLITSINLYQYNYMIDNNQSYYVYDMDKNNRIELWQAEYGIAEQIDTRINNIHNRLVKDICYILNINKSYVIESQDNKLYEIISNDKSTFGNVNSTFNIYLNKIPNEICDLFGINQNDFYYQIQGSKSVPYICDGEFVYNDYENQMVATLNYKDEPICSIKFYNNSSLFNGGSGEANDPYLISNVNQFLQISNGMDKHYKVINNLDFKNETIYPLGQYYNSSNNLSYTKFTGSVDGNGYKLSNINVEGDIYSGIFGQIGAKGEVSNLNIYNIKVNTIIPNLPDPENKIYSGIIAGKNEGTIKFCSVNNDIELEEFFELIPVIDMTSNMIVTDKVSKYGLFIDVDKTNKSIEKNIHVYTGGITGYNFSTIAACTVENTYIKNSISSNIGGNTPVNNQLYVYSGGICGYNSNTIDQTYVDSSTKLYSLAKIVYNPNKNKIKPYIKTYAGGIAGYTDNINNISNVLSEAKVLYNYPALDIESSYDKYYNNTKHYENKYIPELSDLAIQKITSKGNVKSFINSFNKSYDVDIKFENHNENLVFKPGTDKFNLSGMKLYVNEIEINEDKYNILNIYNFNTYNEEFNDKQVDVKLLIKINFNDDVIYVTKNIKITILSNYLENIEINGLKESYLSSRFNDTNPNEIFKLTGLSIVYNYAVGPKKIIPIDNSILHLINVSGNFFDYGNQEIILNYNNEDIKFNINIICNHGNNFINPSSGYEPNDLLSMSPSCDDIGYDAYVCKNCGDIKYYYLCNIEHEPNNNRINVVAPTCVKEGYSGDISCKNCNKIFIYGEKLPKISHDYKYLDEEVHKCNNCNHEEFHQFIITDVIEENFDINGNLSYDVIYKKTCLCKHIDNNCTVIEEVDKNTITDITNKQTTIIVNDGYVLNGGDEVSVYVQLINNNKGINSISFGIRYDDGLELTNKSQTGNLVYGIISSKPSDDTILSDGFNYLWHSITPVYGDGNLIKLTFKVSDNARLNDCFNIYVVISDIGQTIDNIPILGGLTSNNSQLNVVTKNGQIKVVDKLPGDIDENGKVDLSDVIRLSKFFQNSDKYPLSSIKADTNLDGLITPDDILVIEKYLVGGYGINLLPQYFNINLDSKSDNIELDSVLASINDKSNNTYNNVGLINLVKDGYTFKGWSYKLYTDDPKDLIDLNDNIIFNEYQKEQTLYAQWELNKIIFEIDGNLNNVYYYDDEQSINIPKVDDKVYYVSYISDVNSDDNLDGEFTYEFNGWVNHINNVTYYERNELIELLKTPNTGTINLNATYDNNTILNYPNWKYDGYASKPSWFADNDYILKIENSNDIIKNCSTISKNSKTYYKVYSKYNLLKFKIEIDYSGGSEGYVSSQFNREYTMNDTINIWSQVTGYTKQGNTPNGWELYVDNELYGIYKDLQEVKNIVVPEDNNIVIFKALWNPNVYEIYFDNNKPNNASNIVKNMPENNTILWTFSEDGFVLPEEPILFGWDFKGWYAEPQLVNKIGDANITCTDFDLLLKKPTLYAKWEADEVTITFNIGYFPFQDFTSIKAKFDDYYPDYLFDNKSEKYISINRHGCKFAGWSLEMNGDNIISSTTQIKSYNIILYASWNVITQMTFEFNDFDADSFNFDIGNKGLKVFVSNYFDINLLKSDNYNKANISFNGKVKAINGDLKFNYKINMMKDETYGINLLESSIISLDKNKSTDYKDKEPILIDPIDKFLTYNLISIVFYTYGSWGLDTDNNTINVYSNSITVKFLK